MHRSRHDFALFPAYPKAMAFADTYREQVVQSRQDRARKAMFWSRIVGLALMLLIAFVLRVEPAIRTAFAETGMDLMTRMTGRDAPAQTASATSAQPASTAPAQSTLPRDRVKVNRGTTSNAQTSSQSREDAQAQAEELGARLKAIKVGE